MRARTDLTQFQDQGPQLTRGWVIHPELTNNRSRRDPGFALEEAVSLAEALPGFDVQGSEVVKLSKPQPGYLFGSGKVEELGTRLKENDVELVLIDGPLTPVQQRNLEKIWKVKILDRTGLILEIFADRAATREGVLQVELAALSYQRTRLVRSWTHLERQRGGLGFVGGPGETQIEADRRAIDDAAIRLRRQLSRVVKTRELHRAARAKVPFPIVALVGYTNAGKSTLFNLLTGASVMAKDMLFATLDPTMRSVHLSNGTDIILSDTVGFISDLPTELVASFRATLEEVLAADLICHVRDIAHPQSDEQAEDVRKILETLGVGEGVPVIEVWNKSDLLDPDARDSLAEVAARRDEVQVISSIDGSGIEALVEAISERIKPAVCRERVFLGWKDAKRRAWLFEKSLVLEERPDDTGAYFLVEWTPVQKATFQAMA